jgi:hypothetical protein
MPREGPEAGNHLNLYIVYRFSWFWCEHAQFMHGSPERKFKKKGDSSTKATNSDFLPVLFGKSSRGDDVRRSRGL